MKLPRTWKHDLLMLLILVIGAYLRLVGLNWDDNQHLHPDERFLTMVETGLQVKKCAVPSTPIESCPSDQIRWLGLGDYLNTATSTLNPHNRGYGFFVYGDLPIVIVRYIAEWTGQTGYDQVNLLGRQISTLSDLITVLLVYLIASRLYDRRVGLLGAAFSALAVLQIQQSHFFTVDTIANLFIFLALYCAVEIMLQADAPSLTPGAEEAEPSFTKRARGLLRRLRNDRLFVLSLAFGAAVGMAMASKLNAAPLALLLPAAFFIRHRVLQSNEDGDKTASPEAAARWSEYIWRAMGYLVAAAITTIVVFRFTQPYAFQGLGLNPAWLANINDLRGQSSGDVDVPFALQWARRSHLFSLKNLTVWGLGLPLGILAWTGFLVMGWRILKGEWRHALLWGWTLVYFVWQSMVFNPTMRYQLPVYPLLCMMAGWVLIFLWEQRRRFTAARLGRLISAAVLVLGFVVLVLTAAWAFAFSRIYTRPVTRVAATGWIYQNVPAAINLRITQQDGTVYQQPVPHPAGTTIAVDTPYQAVFRANADGLLREVYFPHVANAAAEEATSPITFDVKVARQVDPSGTPGAAASLISEFSRTEDRRGSGFTLTLRQPLPITKGETYTLTLESNGVLALEGTTAINESDWDDGLPLRLGPEGYDAYGGLFQEGLSLQLYWDDNAEKLQRFVDVLGQGDYIFISSNRQWATTTRVPERYPLTTAYYRALIGCPDDKDVIWCYNVARPGMFNGKIGFELAAVFESFPTLDIPGVLRWEANDQFAEEAFTVYDHPKVLVFHKTADYSEAKLRGVLQSVNLDSVVHLTPRQAAGYKSLMLPPAELARQQAGGTWSDLFDYDWIQNRFPMLGLLLWYVFILVLGLVTYPILRGALPGLGDKGYPVARSLGLVLLACANWLVGSAGISVTRLTVGIVFAVLVAVGLGMGWTQRHELAQEWRERRKYFLLVEGLFLAFFVFDLLIRLGNPDLWHPAKGGERPMDFSYFNAIIKSTTFPPYDPWFAGGYINYYYYGFVLVAMPVKLLGIVPTLAYNFILPTLFAIVGMGAFGIGWNLLDATGPSNTESSSASKSFIDMRLIAGVMAAALMVLLGNLGTVRMVYQGLQKMAAPDGVIDSANIFERLAWTAQGVVKAVNGQVLPYARGDWYWNPSRVIPPGPGNEITEFPLFTFLYSDLHAHMLAMPLALLAITWALGVLRAKRVSLLTLLIGGVAIGALYPSNLSDIYTYLPIGFAALAYAIWRSDWAERWRLDVPLPVRKLILIAGSAAVLTVLAYGLYLPYRQAYSQGYSAVEPWTGATTPIWSYLTHWGVFLFIIAFWLGWETRQWLAETPASSLHKLRKYQVLIELGIAVVLAGLLYLAYRGVQMSWIALPLAAWAGVLLLRPGLPDAKRFALFLAGTALAISIVVEILVVRGDIGRMNTVFKFYLQGWALLSVSAGAAFTWLLPEVRRWLPGWQTAFQVGAGVLLAGAGMFTISATVDKISDRMTGGVPITLDSITYMKYAHYADFNSMMDLVQDYRAVRWMQDNVQGSPVIVEANCPEYHWCTRFTIYTGLPGVVGWNWHQRQQRTMTPQVVEARVAEVGEFYNGTSTQGALDFLKRYNVRYIIVGQLERAEYPGAGLDKFSANDGKMWDTVYHDEATTIYQVRP
ncbi:MAG TPA: DUF2298 domain-containing protein [Anaerolineales bacterium]